nr:nucleotide disphospho-sugar-binding domain-containing protein [Saccharomonospora sp. CUA-673]
MRVLITTFPNRSHLLTMIPIAWALRNAGHEVQIAAYPSLVDEVIAAGLTPVLVGDGEDGTVRTLGEESFDRVEEQLAEVDAEWQLAAEDRRSWAVLRNRILPAMAYFCPPLPAEAPQRTATDDLVAYARSWRPDLVLWDPAMVGSPVAARVCGAAHARVLWGPDYFGWVLGLARSGSPGARLAAEAVAGLMRPHAERHGVEFDPETVLGQWTLDPMAAPLRLPSPARSIPMRWVPYNGSRPVPDWLREPPRRPRICIPAATTGYERDWQRVSLGDVLEAVAESDVEALVTMNSAQRAMLPRIPDNVRTMEYLPLSQILPTCSAIIHHGGDGTAAAPRTTESPN